MVTFDKYGFATNDGLVTVYVTDSQGLYSHSVDEFVSIGTTISANSYIDKPLAPKEGFAIKRNDNGWTYVENHLNEVVYSTIDKSEIKISALGPYPDNTTTQKPEHELSEWDNDGKKWIISEDNYKRIKAEQQAQIWELIKQKRHDNLRGGCFVESVGKWFHTNDESRQQYIFMRTLDQLPHNIQWKTMDNSFVHLTKTLLDELSMQMLLDEQADFANAERHKALMEQADNPLDYDFSTGWTEIYQGD